MVIDWFYDKKISIYSYAKHEDSYGFSRDIYTLKQENVFVDIQPSSDKKIYETYGYKVECTKVVYSSMKFDVYSYSDDNYDQYGVSCDGYSLNYENIFVDIQPIGEDKIKLSYGYNIEANYEMYSSQLLQESDIVVWNDKTYKVQKIIPWDDYYISLLLQEDVKLNG